MENRNKVIIILVAAIIILIAILGVKILSNSSDSNKEINSNNIQINSEDNDLIINNETENIINDNAIIESNNETTYDSGEAINEVLTSKSLIIGIINIIIILAIIPMLLRKYNLITCVVVMTIYELILTLIIGNLFTLGILGILIKIVVTFAHYYLFLWVVDKLLLEVGAVAYFFGVIITDIAINWFFEFVLALILSI